MFQIFTRIPLLKVKTLRFRISIENQDMQTVLNKKFTWLVTLYNIFKCEKVLGTFLFFFVVDFRIFVKISSSCFLFIS